MNDSIHFKDISPYKDLRRDFFARFFNQALPFDEYGNSNSLHWPKWQRYFKLIDLETTQKELIKSFKRKLNILVLSGIWCGDCQRQGPMLKAIADSCELINLRFIESRDNPELQDELRINGAEKVPVVVFLSEDFFEIQRFGDRHLSVYKRLIKEQSAAYCETGFGAPEETYLKEELKEWIDTFERVQHLLYMSPFLRKKYNN